MISDFRHSLYPETVEALVFVNQNEDYLFERLASSATDFKVPKADKFAVSSLQLLGKAIKAYDVDQAEFSNDDFDFSKWLCNALRK